MFVRRSGARADAANIESRFNYEENIVNMLSAGSQAPDFTAENQDGTPTTLSAQQGGWVLLWWYPKASTPG